MKDNIQHAKNIANTAANATTQALDPRKRQIVPNKYDIKDIMKKGDLHMIVTREQQGKIYDIAGSSVPLWYIDRNSKLTEFYKHEVHTGGVYGNADRTGWDVVGGDTVPGLYKCGITYPFVPGVDSQAVHDAYGPYAIELFSVDGHEQSYGRDGIMLHCGGTGLPDPWASYQGWVLTHGCMRGQTVFVAAFNKKKEELRQKGSDFFITVL